MPIPPTMPAFIHQHEQHRNDREGRLRATCRALIADLELSCRGLPEDWRDIIARVFRHDIQRAKHLLRDL